MKYFPDLSHAKIVRTWAGWMDASSDGVPSIGKVDEVPGLYVACAFNGHGFGIAPAVGEQLAKLISVGTTDISLEELRYDRYKAKI
jgi:sarcosine oxidase subunit beta